MYAGAGVLREALHVKFVDDCIGLGTWLPVFCPVKCRVVTRQHSQRRSACVWSFPLSQFRIETGREENAFRVRVEENLLRVKAAKLRSGSSRYGVSIVTSITNLAKWDPAVPNPP